MFVAFVLVLATIFVGFAGFLVWSVVVTAVGAWKTDRDWVRRLANEGQSGYGRQTPRGRLPVAPDYLGGLESGRARNAR
jgi:hypothetical protein